MVRSENSQQKHKNSYRRCWRLCRRGHAACELGGSAASGCGAERPHIGQIWRRCRFARRRPLPIAIRLVRCTPGGFAACWRLCRCGPANGELGGTRRSLVNCVVRCCIRLSSRRLRPAQPRFRSHLLSWFPCSAAMASMPPAVAARIGAARREAIDGTVRLMYLAFAYGGQAAFFHRNHTSRRQRR